MASFMSESDFISAHALPVKPEIISFQGFQEIRSNLTVDTGIIKHIESDDVINFEVHPRTSNLDRKLSIIRVFEE